MNEVTLDWETIDQRQQRGDRDLTPMRVGAVSYLNSKPLIEGLGPDLEPGSLELEVPSRLADELASGDLDVALIPSIEFLFNDAYRIVSDACIATRGPVLSVKLYSRVPFGEIRTISLDEGSRTSAVLARIMLRERYGVLPEREILPMGATTVDTTTDAVLLIGDRAITPPAEEFVATWDLGEEWVNWTGLPFVFAMWVARKDIDESEIAPLLERARDRGVERLPQIAAREADSLGLSVETAYHYLRDNLHFRFESPEWRGLSLFRELAQHLENPDPLATTNHFADRELP